MQQVPVGSRGPKPSFQAREPHPPANRLVTSELSGHTDSYLATLIPTTVSCSQTPHRRREGERSPGGERRRTHWLTPGWSTKTPQRQRAALGRGKGWRGWRGPLCKNVMLESEPDSCLGHNICCSLPRFPLTDTNRYRTEDVA